MLAWLIGGMTREFIKATNIDIEYSSDNPTMLSTNYSLIKIHPPKINLQDVMTTYSLYYTGLWYRSTDSVNITNIH